MCNPKRELWLISSLKRKEKATFSCPQQEETSKEINGYLDKQLDGNQ